MVWVVLATEDELSEAVGSRLIEETGRLQISLSLRRNGFGYLRKRIGNFCQMARNQPLILFTDLDQTECPPTLIKEWLGRQHAPENLLFRVAVRETEAWVIADHEAMSALLGPKIGRLPADPDHVNNPKSTLLSLAGQAPRTVRNSLVSEKGSFARQGLGYNAVLARFVREQWSPIRAASRSESLRRARKRIEELERRLK